MLKCMIAAALCLSAGGICGISAAEPTASSRRALIPAPVVVTSGNENSSAVREEKEDLNGIAPAQRNENRKNHSVETGQKASPAAEETHPVLTKIQNPDGTTRFAKAAPAEEPVVIKTGKADTTLPIEPKDKSDKTAGGTAAAPAQTAGAQNQTPAAVNAKPGEKPAQKPAVSQQKKIVINLASRLLTLYEGQTGIRMYPVAAGRPGTDTQTPTGKFSVINMEVNPTWTDPHDSTKKIASGADNPLGYRWIGIGGFYGIHGTNNPSSIGTYASSGCIRMKEKDVEDLYSHISTGIPVEIIYERVVVNEAKDHTVSFYIYPDGYHKEELAPWSVREKLAPYGVDHFVSESTLKNAIDASSGTPIYAAKDYGLYVNGQKLRYDAMGKDGKIYLPFYPIAHETVQKASFDASTGTAETDLGRGAGAVKGDMVYVNSSEAASLFGLEGRLNNHYDYVMTSLKKDKNENGNGNGVKNSSSSYKDALARKGSLKDSKK